MLYVVAVLNRYNSVLFYFEAFQYCEYHTKHNVGNHEFYRSVSYVSQMYHVCLSLCR